MDTECRHLLSNDMINEIYFAKHCFTIVFHKVLKGPQENLSYVQIGFLEDLILNF